MRSLYLNSRQFGIGGIDGTLINILLEVLSNRVRKVVVDGHCSENINVVSGVLQGSMQDPLLLTLYTHE